MANETVDAFLTLARERFKLCVDAEAPQRTNQLFDYQFSSGGDYQWSDADRNLRSGRPMLVNNRTDIYIKQITNQARQQVGGIQVAPVDSGSDPDTAETIEGVIKHIERISDADVAYATASDHQVRMGVGFLRVVPEYLDEQGFDQELKIKRVRNRFSVYCDPAAQEPDGSDARFWFVVEDVESDPDGTGEYQQRYPGTEAATLTDYASVGAEAPRWFPKGKVRIAEYFYEMRTKTEALQTSDGKAYTTETLPELPDGVTIANRRGIEARTVCWATINGVEVLEGNEDKTAGRVLPIPYMPLVRVIGDEFDFGERVDYRGAVRNAIDAQKLSNYMDSATAEMIALAPKAPFVAEETQLEGHPEWNDANQKNYATLLYKATTIAGHLVGPPQRNAVEPPIQAMAVVAQRAENNLRALLGYVDVGEQERRPEQSGKAILARQKQGEVSNNHYLDNLRRAKRQVGRILVAWIPHIYDAPRVMRILGRDDRERTVQVYAGAENAQQPPPGVEKMYNLGAGRYDVFVGDGASNQSRRQEATEMMTQVITAAPQLLEVMGDLYFNNMDWPEARQIGERLKKALPPQFKDPEEGGPPPIPPEVQAEMAQMKEVIGQLMQEKETESAKLASESQRKGAELDAKVQIAQLEAQTKIQIAQMELAAERQIAMMKMQVEQEMAQMKLQMADQQHEADLQHASEMSDTEHGHEREMAMMQPEAEA